MLDSLKRFLERSSRVLLPLGNEAGAPAIASPAPHTLEPGAYLMAEQELICCYRSITTLLRPVIVLSWLGIGAGDYADEAQGLGMPYSPAAERCEMLAETVHICLRMCSDEHGDEITQCSSHANGDGTGGHCRIGRCARAEQ